MKKNTLHTICALSLLACTAAHANKAMHKGLKVCTVSSTLNACSTALEDGKDKVRIRFSEYPVEIGTLQIVCDYNNTNLIINSVKSVKGDFNFDYTTTSITDPKAAHQGKLSIQLNKAAKADKIKGAVDLEVTGDESADKHALNIRNCKGVK